MQKKIIEYIQQNPTAYQATIAKDLQTSRTYVGQVLKDSNILVPHKAAKQYTCLNCGIKITKDSKSGWCVKCFKINNRIQAVCDECDNSYTTLKSQYKRTKLHFCSNVCKGRHLGKNNRKKLN